MEQKSVSFDEQYKFGQEGEIEISNTFKNKGFMILPVWQFTKDSAPVLYGKNQDLILPDMVIFKHLECAFVEAKRKRQYVHYEGGKETGISYRLYKQYMAIHFYTGLDVLVAFLQEEEEPTGMFYVNLLTEGRLWDGINRNGVRCSEALYFWKLKDLQTL